MHAHGNISYKRTNPYASLKNNKKEKRDPGKRYIAITQNVNVYLLVRMSQV